MKKAEHWALPVTHKDNCTCLTCKNTRAIQLDAWKQGMTDAQDLLSLVSRSSNCPLSDANEFIKNAIRLKLKI